MLSIIIIIIDNFFLIVTIIQDIIMEGVYRERYYIRVE